MAQRSVHYEAAFEDYIRSRTWPYVPVDEQKRAVFSGVRVKSFDFIVYPPGRDAWLCDVKGRKFPYEGKSGKRYWENWVPREDLDGLRRWREVFGQGFEPMIAFVYWLLDGADHETTAFTAGSRRSMPSAVHVFRNRVYSILCVSASDYEAHARQRSPSWDTVTVPTREFRQLAVPIGTDL